MLTKRNAEGKPDSAPGQRSAAWRACGHARKHPAGINAALPMRWAGPASHRRGHDPRLRPNTKLATARIRNAMKRLFAMPAAPAANRAQGRTAI
jgi:hypothetical protein